MDISSINIERLTPKPLPPFWKVFTTGYIVCFSVLFFVAMGLRHAYGALGFYAAIGILAAMILGLIHLLLSKNARCYSLGPFAWAVHQLRNKVYEKHAAQFEEIRLEILRLMDTTTVSEMEVLLGQRPELNTLANQAILWKWRANRVDEWMLKDPVTNITEMSEFFRSIAGQD